jgi:hypothetical protein
MSSESTTATFADDTAVLATDSDPAIAAQKLQTNLLAIQNWFKKWRMKANGFKSIDVTLTTRKDTCPPVQVNNVQLPKNEEVEYLGLHLDRRHLAQTNFRKAETTRNHPHQNVLITQMQVKTLQTTNFFYTKQYSNQSGPTEYNSTSNIEILESFQSKTLRMIVDAPWYVPNTVIRRDLQIPTVKEEIQRYSSDFSARLSAHPNDLIANLVELPDNRRLRRHLPNYLPTRFLA